MAKKLTDLAARIKEAVAEVDHEQERAREAAEVRAEQEGRRREAMIAARRELLDEIKAFGRELQVLDVTQDKSGLSLAWGDRTLRFDAESDDGSIDVLWSGATDDECIVWDDRNTWIWVHDEHELPLLEDGLEDLVVSALGLPRPQPVEGHKRPKPKRTTASYRKAGLVQEITLEQSAPARSALTPPEPHQAIVGRSGTRGFKRESNVTPGSGRREKKGFLT